MKHVSSNALLLHSHTYSIQLEDAGATVWVTEQLCTAIYEDMPYEEMPPVMDTFCWLWSENYTYMCLSVKIIAMKIRETEREEIIHLLIPLKSVGLCLYVEWISPELFILLASHLACAL